MSPVLMRNSTTGSEQENAEFLTRELVRIDQVERLRVGTAHHVLVIRPHVHDLLRLRLRPDPGRYDSHSDSRRLHGLEHQPHTVALFSLRRETKFPAIAVHGPDGNGPERARSEFGAVAFESDPDESEAHFVDELVSQQWELEE